MSKSEQRRFQQQMMRVQENRIKNRRQKESFTSALIIFCWVLHDKFGFGGKRLEKLVDEIHEIIEAYNDGYINAKDLIEQLEKETGIKF